MKSEIDSLHTQLKNARLDDDSQGEALRSLNKRKSHLERDLEEKDEHISDLKRQIKKLTTQCDEANIEKTRLKNREKKTQQLVMEKSETIADLEEEIIRLKSKVNDDSTEQSFLLKAPLREAQKRVQFLEQEIERLESELKKA